ncbi:hypothetical protein MKX59_19535 [Paenibacillus sp. FSL R7-0340]|uniref:hypothetical protein n=1 Tax=Paenibacillus sp. FSL R7-0340 TaxID=2921684 RepID=UPI0030FC1F35
MDKKIQEIREALAAATPGDWQEEGAEIWKRGKDYQCDNRHVHICDVVDDSNRKLIANAPTYISYLLQQIEIKDKALGFYADLENWEQYYGSLDIDSAILNDCGIIARAALKGEDTNE